MAKKYVLTLTVDAQERLERITCQGKAAAWKIQRANALLKCDQGSRGPGWTDERIADAFGVTVRSIEHWRQEAVEHGPEALLERKVRPPTPSKLDGEGEARLMMLACSEPPPGHARWTLRLLAKRLVELEVVEVVSHETVGRGLKKAR